MSDTFRQEVVCKLPAPADPWAIAADAESILEAGFGPLWKDVDREYTGNTESRIKFEAADLPTLKQQMQQHGGPIAAIHVDANYWDGVRWTMVATYIWPRVEGRTEFLHVHIRGPLRVEVESLALTVKRMVEGFRRRKRWAGAQVTIRPMEISSDADPAFTPKRGVLIRTAGLRPQLWRWFVLNRDNLIIGLGGGLIISLVVIVLQVIGIIPTPN